MPVGLRNTYVRSTYCSRLSCHRLRPRRRNGRPRLVARAPLSDSPNAARQSAIEYARYDCFSKKLLHAAAAPCSVRWTVRKMSVPHRSRSLCRLLLHCPRVLSRKMKPIHRPPVYHADSKATKGPRKKVCLSIRHANVGRSRLLNAAKTSGRAAHFIEVLC